jgi:hypothetical protein
MDSGIGGAETISPKCALTKQQADTGQTVGYDPSARSPWNERDKMCI